MLQEVLKQPNFTQIVLKIRKKLNSFQFFGYFPWKCFIIHRWNTELPKLLPFESVPSLCKVLHAQCQIFQFCAAFSSGNISDNFPTFLYMSRYQTDIHLKLSKLDEFQKLRLWILNYKKVPSLMNFFETLLYV